MKGQSMAIGCLFLLLSVFGGACSPRAPGSGDAGYDAGRSDAMADVRDGEADVRDGDMDADASPGEDTPPLYQGPSELWILEGSEGYLVFRLDEGNGPEEDPQTVSVTVKGTSDESLLPLAGLSVDCNDQGDGCQGYLVVQPAPGKLGSGQVVLQVSDGRHTLDVTIDVLVEGPAGGGSLKYVSATADGSGDGSRTAPWTMEQANRNARAGDTLVILSGEYHTGVGPEQDGEEGNPIRFVAEARRRAVVVEPGSVDHLLDLVGRSHVQVIGLRFESAGTSRLVSLDGADHILIQDCVVLGRGFFDSAYVDVRNAHDIDLVDSRFERAKQNLFRVRNVTRYRVLGIMVGRAGHGPMFQDTGMQDVIFRGSATMGMWGRASGFSGGPTRLLFERNVVSGSIDAGRSAGSDFKFQGNGSIYRLNRAYDNGPCLFTMRDYRPEAVIRHMRIYGNIIHDIVDRAFWLNRKGDGIFEDVRFQNNVFLDNDRFGVGYHIRGSHVEGLVQLSHNLFFGQADETPTPSEILGVPDDGNLYVDPLFEDPSRRDYMFFRADSPLPEGGAPLAHTVTAGSGRDVPLDDAYWAFDGFGFDDEEGDLIQVGGERARVVHADWASGVLTLDRDITWNVDDPVGLAWEGSAPAIGCYEQGTGLEHLGILASAGKFQSMDVVWFELVGVDSDARVVWHFGDGVQATGRIVRHAYGDPGRYAVRAEVRGGPSWQRTAMVVVVSDRSVSDPLVNLDFSLDDDTARIKTDTWSRPLPDISRIDAPVGKALRIEVSSGNGGLESRFYPLQGWDVDAYPYLVVSYNIDPGVDLNFGMEAFSVTEDTAKRRMDSDEVTFVADGQWHELAIDVRTIRDAYPDVEYLAGVIFYGPEGQGAGRGYAFQTFCVSATTTCPRP